MTSRLSPSSILRRAWQLFRYQVPGTPFSRAFFASCLRTAWAEARKAAAIAALSAAERTARLADLAADLTWESMSDSRTALPRMAAIRAEMALYRASPALAA